MPIPDNEQDRSKAAFVATSTTDGDGAPARRVILAAGGGGVFPAAAAKGDALATPTVTEIGALLQGFNGTTWDRIRSGDVNNVAAATGFLPALGVFRYNATLPTLTDTRFNVGQVGSRGSLHTELWNANAASTMTANNATDAGNGALVLPAVGYAFNGTTFDRMRSSSIGTGIQMVSPPDYSYLNIPAGQATTVVKASAGELHSLVLNSAATATNTTTVYDNASGAGTVIGRPAVTTATVPTTLLYNCKFALGLTIITATANGGDMTVVYR